MLNTIDEECKDLIKSTSLENTLYIALSLASAVLEIKYETKLSMIDDAKV